MIVIPLFILFVLETIADLVRSTKRAVRLPSFWAKIVMTLFCIGTIIFVPFLWFRFVCALLWRISFSIQWRFKKKKKKMKFLVFFSKNCELSFNLCIFCSEVYSFFDLDPSLVCEDCRLRPTRRVCEWYRNCLCCRDIAPRCCRLVFHLVIWNYYYLIKLNVDFRDI